MITGGQGQVGGDVAQAAGGPGVDHQYAVHPHARAVVHAQCEVVGAAVKIELARPAGGKVIGEDAAIGRTYAPIEVHCWVIARERRQTAERHVVPIVPTPIGDDDGRRRWSRGRGGYRRWQVRLGWARGGRRGGCGWYRRSAGCHVGGCWAGWEGSARLTRRRNLRIEHAQRHRGDIHWLTAVGRDGPQAGRCRLRCDAHELEAALRVGGDAAQAERCADGVALWA